MGGPAIIGGKKYKEFDNFYCGSDGHFKLDGERWRSVENYYQSRKNPDDYKYLCEILFATPYEAWKMGQECPLPDDWDSIKYDVMALAVGLKFMSNNNLITLLRDSEGIITFTGGSPYWNEANAKILSDTRDYIRNGYE